MSVGAPPPLTRFEKKRQPTLTNPEMNKRKLCAIEYERRCEAKFREASEQFSDCKKTIKKSRKTLRRAEDMCEYYEKRLYDAECHLKASKLFSIRRDKAQWREYTQKYANEAIVYKWGKEDLDERQRAAMDSFGRLSEPELARLFDFAEEHRMSADIEESSDGVVAFVLSESRDHRQWQSDVASLVAQIPLLLADVALPSRGRSYIYACRAVNYINATGRAMADALISFDDSRKKPQTFLDIAMLVALRGLMSDTHGTDSSDSSSNNYEQFVCANGDGRLHLRYDAASRQIVIHYIFVFEQRRRTGILRRFVEALPMLRRFGVESVCVCGVESEILYTFLCNFTSQLGQKFVYQGGDFSMRLL